MVPLLMLVGLCSQAYAESDALEVKILAGSSDENSHKSFYPEILPFENHDTITWVNEDIVAHSIASGVPAHLDYSGKYFDTNEIAAAKSATINTENLTNFAYYYFCEIHPWLTGKLVLESAVESQPETENPVSALVRSGEISVKGQVHDDFAGIKYEILVYEYPDKLVDIKQGILGDDGSYTNTIMTRDLSASKYLLKVVYGLPTQVATTTFEISQVNIPKWIKIEAKSWSSGEISDIKFIAAIEYLAKEKIISIQKTQTDNQIIPAWLKTNASWWADGMISDSEFAQGLQYLADSGIIQL
jgi:plastocyanin